MIKKITLLCALIVGVVVAVDSTFNHGFTNILGSQSGNAGDPAAAGTTCAQSGCHDSYGNARAASAALNTIQILNGTSPVTSYTPGTTYNVKVSAYGSHLTTGFELVSENASGAFLGSFTAGSDSKICTSGGANKAHYITHMTSGTGKYKTWSFQWTAPASASGPVTFYCAVNSADNDNSASNDSIYTATLTISDASGVNNIASEHNISIFPNPTKNILFINNLPSISKAEVSVFALNGQMVMNSMINDFNSGINVSELNKGIYLLQLKSEKGTYSQKFVKE